MNEEQFEQELRWLPPRPTTAGLAAGIAAQLAAPHRAVTFRVRWIAAALAAAACVAVVFFLYRAAPDPHHPIATRPSPDPVGLATLAMYQRALGDSGEAVDALLRQDDRYVASARSPTPPTVWLAHSAPRE